VPGECGVKGSVASGFLDAQPRASLDLRVSRIQAAKVPAAARNSFAKGDFQLDDKHMVSPFEFDSTRTTQARQVVTPTHFPRWLIPAFVGEAIACLGIGIVVGLAIPKNRETVHQSSPSSIPSAKAEKKYLRSEFEKVIRDVGVSARGVPDHQQQLMKKVGKPYKTQKTPITEWWSYHDKTVDDVTGKTDFAVVLEWSLSDNILVNVVFYPEDPSAQHE
jgi:hypothetical protein